MTLSLLIEPHWATGESFKQNLPRVEAASPLMRNHCRRALPAASRARPHFPLSDKQTDAVMWALWEDWREANGGASPLRWLPLSSLTNNSLANYPPALWLDGCGGECMEKVLVITMEKSHLSLPWQLFLLLSSTGKQSCQINRIQV